MRNYLIIFFLILFIIPIGFKNISALDYEMNSVIDGFGWSMGLSLNEDRIYVSDGLHNQILVFDKLENIFLERISLEEKSCTGHIHGMEIMNQKIFIVKQNQNCIPIFDLTGKFLYEFGKNGNGEGEFNGPQNLEIYQENIFVTDSNNNRIQVFDLTGEFLYEFGKNGNGEGEFNGALGIKINKNQIFVTDSGNNRIQIFDLTGKYVDQINENFNSPHQISLSENYIYVLDTYNYQLKIFSNQNQLEFNEDMSETNDFSLTIIIILSIIIIIVVYTIFLRNKLV